MAEMVSLPSCRGAGQRSVTRSLSLRHVARLGGTPKVGQGVERRVGKLEGSGMSFEYLACPYSHPNEGCVWPASLPEDKWFAVTGFEAEED